MPRVRLTGLFLFITVLCLGLATAITRTSHIRFKRSDKAVAAEATTEAAEGSPNQIQFVAVPVIYPLVGLGMLGLGLWFVPAALTPLTQSRRSSSRRQTRSKRNQGFFGLGRSARRR